MFDHFIGIGGIRRIVFETPGLPNGGLPAFLRRLSLIGG
jgi:hypothetical protein